MTTQPTIIPPLVLLDVDTPRLEWFYTHVEDPSTEYQIKGFCQVRTGRDQWEQGVIYVTLTEPVETFCRTVASFRERFVFSRSWLEGQKVMTTRTPHPFFDMLLERYNCKTDTQMGDMLGFTSHYICMMRNRHRPISDDFILAVHETLDIPIETLKRIQQEYPAKMHEPLKEQPA